MRLENFSITKSKGYVFLLAAILILTSCNSTRQTADYPNFYTPHLQKTETRFAGKLSTRKSALNDISKPAGPSIPLSESGSKTGEVKPHLPNKALYKRYIQLITSGADMPGPKTNESTLTASLSTEPILTRHAITAKTARVPGITTSDTTKSKVTQAPASTTTTDEQADLAKQKRLKAFAIVSLVTALLSIVTLFFLPGVFLLLAAAAIVFGALGLRSTIKKYRAMAIAGMVIGIAMILLLVLAILAYAGILFA
jgi:hypothetical protein